MFEQWTCLSCQRSQVLREIYDQQWVSRKKGNEFGKQRGLMERTTKTGEDCVYLSYFQCLMYTCLYPNTSTYSFFCSLLPSSSGEVSLTCPSVKDKQMECKIRSWVLRVRERGFLWGSPCPPSTLSYLSSIQTTHNSGGQLTVPSWPHEDPGAAHLSIHLTLAPALPQTSIHMQL